MDVRPAQPQESDAIRAIAEQSFQTSYSLSPGQIETILEGVFSSELLAERTEADADLLLVALDGDELIGFIDIGFDEEAVLRWLHVEPGARGRGAGTQLFERALSAAQSRGVPLVARVLTEDEEGGTFCEQFGFTRNGRSKLTFAEETFFQNVYVDPNGPEGGIVDQPVEIPETITADREELSLDRDDDIPGTDGSFFPTFTDDPDGRRHRYGYFCSNCGSTDVGTDSLGRLECQNCGNKHLADKWDAAYLD